MCVYRFWQTGILLADISCTHIFPISKPMGSSDKKYRYSNQTVWLHQGVLSIFFISSNFSASSITRCSHHVVSLLVLQSLYTYIRTSNRKQRDRYIWSLLCGVTLNVLFRLFYVLRCVCLFSMSGISSWITFFWFLLDSLFNFYCT